MICNTSTYTCVVWTSYSSFNIHCRKYTMSFKCMSVNRCATAELQMSHQFMSRLNKFKSVMMQNLTHKNPLSLKFCRQIVRFLKMIWITTTCCSTINICVSLYVFSLCRFLLQNVEYGMLFPLISISKVSKKITDHFLWKNLYLECCLWIQYCRLVQHTISALSV